MNLTPQRWQHIVTIYELAVEVAPPLSTGPFSQGCGPTGHSSKFSRPYPLPPVRNVALRRCYIGYSAEGGIHEEHDRREHRTVLIGSRVMAEGGRRRLGDHVE